MIQQAHVTETLLPSQSGLPMTLIARAFGLPPNALSGSHDPSAISWSSDIWAPGSHALRSYSLIIRLATAHVARDRITQATRTTRDVIGRVVQDITAPSAGVFANRVPVNEPATYAMWPLSRATAGNKKQSADAFERQNC